MYLIYLSAKEESFNMKVFRMSILILLLTLFTLAGSTYAQSEFVYCGDLAEADCDLLKASQQAMLGVHSGASDFDISLSMSNVPEMPFDQLEITLNGEGVYAIDPALLEQLAGMQMDPSQFMDPSASMAIVGDLLTGVAADFTLTLNIPPQLIAMAAGETPIPESITLPLRMVEGSVYVNLDDVAAAAPPDAGIPPGWLGINLADMMGEFEAFGMGMDSETVDTAAFEEYVQSIMDPAMMGQFLTVERVADEDVMGQTAAVFRSTFDYAAFFQSDMFQNLMQAQFEMAAAATGEELSADDQAEMDEIMSQMGPMMEGISLEIIQAIGLDDNYVHRMEIHMSWDMSSFIAMMEPEADASGATFTFDMSINSSDFNSEVSVVAPDGAFFPLDAMMQGT
jgi:hypothetical protein